MGVQDPPPTPIETLMYIAAGVAVFYLAYFLVNRMFNKRNKD